MCLFERLDLKSARGRLSASFLPSHNMTGWSLRHEGEELLVQRPHPRVDGAIYGIPMLYPWANRLGGPSYEVGNRTVTLGTGTPGLELEENGLPIHGLLNGCQRWRITARWSDRFEAELDVDGRSELFRGFPFPHLLRLIAELDDRSLTVTTTIVPGGSEPVPVAFGFHPYLRIPGTPRTEWTLTLAARRRAVLDERLVPTGAWRPAGVVDGQLRERGFDDLFTDFGGSPAFALSGAGRRLAVRFLDGYSCGQLWAPPDADVVSFEPMTAPGNALRSGCGLRLTRTPFTARFAIDVEDSA
jgi:galactose mutarotase-like enzyme